MRLAAPVCAALAVSVALLSPAPASAVWGNASGELEGADLISADYQRLEQGDDSTIFAAISASGRYVAIQTRARNLFADGDADPPGGYRAGGVFRFDLQSRALEKVADGDLFDETTNEFLLRGAFNPSISASGRFVAFTTGQQLAPGDSNDNLDVYVRDMDVPAGEPGAYDLVSARDGGDSGASYGPPAEPFPGSEPGAGASRGVAISGDGQRVVFRTDAPSDLPASGAIDVPARQLLLRDRSADTTTLVTATRDPGTGQMTAQPAGGALGAALSADGTTVAWTGESAGAQTRFLGGETADPGVPYYLWRRVADGPDAPTRRVTGLSDPDDPACPSGESTVFDQFSEGPCFGPLTDQEANRTGIGEQPPALSGDGYTVAFLTGSGPRPLAFTGSGLDLYLADMTPGLTRKQATIELTRDPATFEPSTSSPISGVAMTPDAGFLAITTVRTKFTLPALDLTSPIRTDPNAREIYLIDLRERTLERVAHSTDGGDIDGDVLDGATISADGGRVAFASFAGDLFFGDANQRADAFVVTHEPDPEAGGPEAGTGGGGPDAIFETDPEGPRIVVTAKSRADGAVVLAVSVPAAGEVKATASARAGLPRKPRTLARATARAVGTARSTVRVVLRPVVRYRAELRERGTIAARALVSYVASRGGRRASAARRIRFRQGAPHPSRRGRK